MEIESKSDFTLGESRKREPEDEEHGEELELETTTGQFQTLKLQEPRTGSGQDGTGLSGVDDDDEAAEKIMNSALLVGLITSKLPAKDLLTLRRTCKMWNFTFLLRIRKIHKPISLFVPVVPRSSRNHDRSLTDFINAFQHRPTGREELPFAHYTLQSGHFWSSSPFLDRGADSCRCECGCGAFRTMYKIGTFITCLELAHWTGYYGAPIAVFRKLIFEGTPRLEELTLVVCTARPFPINQIV